MGGAPAPTAAPAITVSPDGTGTVSLVTPSVPAPPSATPEALKRVEDVADAMLREALAAQGASSRGPTPGGSPAPGEDPTGGAPPAAEATPPAPEPTPSLVFEAPAREADGEPVKIAVQTQAELDALNRLSKGYARREQAAAILAKAEEKEAALVAFQDRLQRDPIGFLTESLDAGTKPLVLKALLAELYDTEREAVETLAADEAARERTKRETLETRTRLQREYDEQAEVRAYTRSINAAIDAMIPEAMQGDAVADEFVEFAGTYLSQQLRRGVSVTPADVPTLLGKYAPRFFATGASAPVVTPSATPPSAQGAGVPASAPAPAAAPTATPTVVPITPANLLARAGAAAMVPAGAGATPSTLEKPPAGMRLEEAIDWHIRRAQTAAS